MSTTSKPLLSSACCLLLALSTSALTSDIYELQNVLLQAPTNTITKASYATLLATAAGIRERLGYYSNKDPSVVSPEVYWGDGPFSKPEDPLWWANAVCGLSEGSIPLTYWLPKNVCNEFGNFVYNDYRLNIMGMENFDDWKTVVSCTTNISSILSFEPGEDLVAKLPILYNIESGSSYPTIDRRFNGYSVEGLRDLWGDLRKVDVWTRYPSVSSAHNGWNGQTLASLCEMSPSELDSLYQIYTDESKRLYGKWIYGVANGIAKASTRILRYEGGVDHHPTLNRCGTCRRVYRWYRNVEYELKGSNNNLRVRFYPYWNAQTSVTMETNDVHNVTFSEALKSTRSTSLSRRVSVKMTYRVNGTTGPYYWRTNRWGNVIHCGDVTVSHDMPYGTLLSVSASEVDEWQMSFVPYVKYPDSEPTIYKYADSGQTLFIGSIYSPNHGSNIVNTIDSSRIENYYATWQRMNDKIASFASRPELNPIFNITRGTPYIEVNSVEVDVFIATNPFDEIVSVWTSDGTEFLHYENLETGDTYSHANEIREKRYDAATYEYDACNVLEDVENYRDIYFANYILWNHAHALKP